MSNIVVIARCSERRTNVRMEGANGTRHFCLNVGGLTFEEQKSARHVLVMPTQMYPWGIILKKMP